MIIKTHAIALKINPFSETSHIVTWLTSDYGKIATIIKGAQRPKNSFIGQYDLFYTCELLFYLRLFQGLHIVRECSPLKSRSPFRTRWPGTVCASYFTGLVSKSVPFYAAHKNIYTLLETALDFFSEENNLEAGLFWFELKLLETMGFAPQLNACLQCRRALTPSGYSSAERDRGKIVFSAARGGILCGKCADSNKACIPISPDILALLKFWQSAGKTLAVRNTVCNGRQAKNAGALLGSFLQHHLESENTGREIALSLLRLRNGKSDHPSKI